MSNIENKTEKEYYAPLAVFAYNRADKIVNCLKALAGNGCAKYSDVFVFCDGPKEGADSSKIDATRKAVDEFAATSPFREMQVIKAEKNKGLAASIIDGVTRIVNEYGKVIVVEDDLIVSDKFLSYMNGALDFYEGNSSIGAISAYTYPLKGLKSYNKDVYIMHKGDCWGWATWRDRWNNAAWADLDYETYLRDHELRKRFESTENGWDMIMLLQSLGKVNSWAIRWVLNLLQKGLCTVYPSKSYVTNNGFDGTGTHSNKSEENLYFAKLSDHPEICRFEELEPNLELEIEAAAFPRKGMKANLKYLAKRLYIRLTDIKMGY